MSYYLIVFKRVMVERELMNCNLVSMFQLSKSFIVIIRTNLYNTAIFCK